MLRFSICLVAAGQLAKFSFVLRFAYQGTFFWFFIAYAGAQVVLAAYALLHFPMKRALELNTGVPSCAYEVLLSYNQTLFVLFGGFNRRTSALS